MTDELTRRRFLEAGALAGAVGLAGCAGTGVGTLPPASATTRTTDAEQAAVGTADASGSDGDRQVEHSHESDERTFSEEIHQQARRVGARVQESVVKVTYEGGRGGGTGWVVDDGYVVTNAHIAQNGTSFRIETFDGATGAATRVGYDRDLAPDVGLLETDLDAPALPTGDSATLENGQPLLVVGHPGRFGDWVISLGPFHSRKPGIDWLLTDAPTQPGNSGSPLVTLEGNAVGLVSGTTTPNGKAREPVSRPETVYEQFPRPDELATATPIETVTDLTSEWR